MLTGKLSMVELAGGGGYRFASASLFGAGLNPWDRSRLVRRLLERTWKRGCGRARHLRDRLRDFRVDIDTERILRCYWITTDVRTGQPLWRDGVVLDDGQARTRCAGPPRIAESFFRPSPAKMKKTLEPPVRASTSRRSSLEIRRPFELATHRLISRPGPNLQLSRHSGRRLDVFRSLGVTFVETELPDLPYGAVTGIVIDVEGASVFEELIESGRIDELVDKKQIAD